MHIDRIRKSAPRAQPYIWGVSKFESIEVPQADFCIHPVPADLERFHVKANEENSFAVILGGTTRQFPNSLTSQSAPVAIYLNYCKPFLYVIAKLPGQKLEIAIWQLLGWGFDNFFCW